VALRAQLEAMADGGVYVITVPEAPYRCPPGPYERVCQVAAYFKARKPRSKILVLDANADVTSKGPLFKKAWTDLYPGMIEFRGNSKAIDVDWRAGTVKLEFGDVQGDVLNVVPPQRAGVIAAPYITANRRWCEVDWLTFESKAVKGVHVLGDALQIAPAMPKSGQHGQWPRQGRGGSDRGVAEQRGPEPVAHARQYLLQHGLRQACDPRDVGAQVRRDGPDLQGRAGLGRSRPAAMSEAEGAYTMNWARNIWADALL
jgi:hypothetical protein